MTSIDLALKCSIRSLPMIENIVWSLTVDWCRCSMRRCTGLMWEIE